jgi:acetyl esterase/lipase
LTALDSESVELETLVYGCVDGTPLHLDRYRLADAARRRGQAVAMVHGGAWTSNDRRTPEVLCRHLASAGFDLFSLDFRDGRNGKHPCAVQDITAGIRFIRANAHALGVDAGSIGLIGSSSGGHLVLLAATQPDLEAHRGTAVMVAGEATDGADVSAKVCCVAALWPVSDPLVRFQYALRVGREELAAAHRRYYRDEAHMLEASVPRMLRAGEAQFAPPLLLVQPGEDANVPRQMTLDLVREYQNAGGSLHYEFLPGLPHAFAYQASPETTRLGVTVERFLAASMGAD